MKERQKIEFPCRGTDLWNWDSAEGLSVNKVLLDGGTKGESLVGAVGPFPGVHMPLSCSGILMYSFWEHGTHSGGKS